MKLTVALLGLTVLTAPAAFADPAEGKAIYEQRCVMCHASGMAGAPLLEKLQTLENEAILKALNAPVPMMAGVVSSLSDQDKRNISVYLSKKTLAASGDLPEVKAD